MVKILLVIAFVALPLYTLSASAHPRVVLGGTGGLPSLSDPAASSVFRKAPAIGLYIHFNATDAVLFPPTLRAVAKIFADKPVIAEVSLGGGFTPRFWTTAWKTNVTGYGFKPLIAVVNVNVDSAQAEAPAGATEADLKDFEAFAKSGMAEGGLQILAPVVSPNSSGGAGPEGDAKTLAVKHPWSDSWWDRLRTMAQVGGGIAFDAPPAFFLRGLPDQAQIKAYQAFTIAGLRWAADQHLWSIFIVSPYFDSVAFQSDSEKAYRILLDAEALPQTWVVENYNLCGPPFPRACTAADAAFLAPVGRDDVPNTEASVALWFARHAAQPKRPIAAAKP